MESIEARALKSTQQLRFDDFTCDDFFVDDLLDFSDKDFEEEDEAKLDSEEDEANRRSFASTNLCDNTNTEFGSFSPGELIVPAEDLENLEWLSQFVEDSGSEVSLLCPVGNFKGKIGSFLENRCEPVTRPEVRRVREPCFPLPAYRKPRGKRSRPSGTLIWTVGSASATPESSLTSGSFVDVDPVQENDKLFSIEKPPMKKQKKKPEGVAGSASGGSQAVRRCSHCQVQKTPQWRTGPLGPKTLCNACGVRFKSGRLYPEYRPACSPSFSQEIHSNSHRKVLEMRRQKEVAGRPETGLYSMF